MAISRPVSRLTFFDKFTTLGMGHILAIPISVGSRVTISFVQSCAVFFTAWTGMVLGVILVFFLTCVRICCVIFGRARFPHRFTSKFISHDVKFEQR